jgi:putative sterol carrier protein
MAHWGRSEPHGGTTEGIFGSKEERRMETGRQAQQAAGPQPLSVSSLAGLSARLRVDVGGQPARMLEIHDGTFSSRPAAGAEDADAVLQCDSEETVAAFRRGELNPIVAMLQGRMHPEGDAALAIRVIQGLQAVFHPPPASARALQVDDGARKER